LGSKPPEHERDGRGRRYRPHESALHAAAGRFALRKVRTCRTASATFSFLSFQGKRLTCEFGAVCTISMAVAYGCASVLSGSTSNGVWQSRTNSRVAVSTKSTPPYIFAR